jgi:hypothetical protein
VSVIAAERVAGGIGEDDAGHPFDVLTAICGPGGHRSAS